MRPGYPLCAAGLVWAVTASGAAIQNPSFESFDDAMRPTGWTYVDSGTPDAQGLASADWVTDGAWALKLSSSTQNAWGTNVGVAQDVDFTGIGSLEFDARISVAAGNGCYLDLLIYDGPGREGIPTAYWSSSITGTWLDKKVDVSHLSGVHGIEFRYVWGSPLFTGPATAYVDNVRLHEGTIPPSGGALQNPSFESFDEAMRPTGWIYVADGTPDAQGFASADWVTDGAWALKISSPTQNGWGTNVGVAQYIDFSGLLSLEFDARISVAAGNGCYLDLLIYEGSGGTAATVYWSRSEAGTWLDQSVDVSRLSGVHRIEFRYVWGSPIYTGPATAYVDNVRVHEGAVSARRVTWGGLKALYRK